jgi:hypothetical protein
MPNDYSNGSWQSRLDRMEGLMNLLIEDHVRFDDEHTRLLIAQVIFTDRVDKVTIAVKELTESQKHTDERNTLITVVDDLVRKRRPNNPPPRPF